MKQLKNLLTPAANSNTASGKTELFKVIEERILKSVCQEIARSQSDRYMNFNSTKDSKRSP
jgi:hypothetical protein